MEKPVNDNALILFDGICNLCNSAVIFIIQHDRKNYFHFASLQSEIGKKKLAEYKINSPEPNSIVLIENNKVYIKSTATLRILRRLDKLYSLLYGLIIIPYFIRNIIYDFIARNRYKWFGKRNECMIPTEKLKEKFIS